MKAPQKMQAKIQERIQYGALRTLSIQKQTIDFSSNDYLGFAKSETIFNKAHQFLIDRNLKQNGATGSRLLSGNSELYEEVETQISAFHNGEAALLFNSGYDANIGFFSSVPQRGDIILYDEYIHASIRDGIGMSNAKSFKFKHNDLEDLAKKVINISQKLDTSNQEVYIVTESVFSMDGDSPNLLKLVQFCNKNNCHLVVDEAHALGVFGNQGEGLLQELGLEKKVFARIYTFGKALGCHGAVVIGSKELKTYLTNFARSFIYTTGLSPHAIATIKVAYDQLSKTSAIQQLKKRIVTFREMTTSLPFIVSESAIHCYIIAGNEKVKKVANTLQSKDFDVKPIMSPTVSKGQERLRFCLHAYNSTEEIKKMIHILTNLEDK
ncbi:pyridoxal phosphate-dependent aminotransferase family protein [uncultured Kordia sp.]|uniref:aminotransferase class I/II-fold pyridoxal phosphate-dependent enzyme n=1 Tax=uncultured Kordia sp. TaxID=507699 RepID=UPI00261E1C11|nr:pyridoxal phosphate-dependent aminotransferase family protein [uncultured Kordia sp.]